MPSPRLIIVINVRLLITIKCVFFFFTVHGSEHKMLLKVVADFTFLMVTRAH